MALVIPLKILATWTPEQLTWLERTYCRADIDTIVRMNLMLDDRERKERAAEVTHTQGS